jgi:hypothetical protein
MKHTFLLLTLLLLSTGCQNSATREIGEFGGRVVDLVMGSTAQVDAVRMEDADFPDERRIGINRLVKRSYGTQPPYTTRFAQIARDDSSPLVRATTIRALNRARDASAVDLFIASLSDTEALVRLEAAKALTNIPSEKAVPELIRVVRNPQEEQDVRIAAAQALRHYKRLDVARVLVAHLQDRRFGISWQARQSLRNITGADYRYDESAWLNYLTSDQSQLS